MAKYIPRLSAPGKEDNHWLHYKSGGVNKCVEIKNGSVLPNCVGYAWGRWYELLGKTPKLSRSNAESWWNNDDGYERGQVPKLGAVCCWSKGVVGVGEDGAGHVAIVEQVNSDGSIVTSNSAWNKRGGTWWYKKTLKPPYIMKGYDFQGFIYLPMEFDEDNKEVKPTESARAFLRSLAGTYEVTAKSGLNVRYGAGVTKKKMVAIPCGKQVECYGYYTDKLGTKWLKIRFHYLGIQYTGFASGEHLNKV